MKITARGEWSVEWPGLGDDNGECCDIAGIVIIPEREREGLKYQGNIFDANS